MLPLTGGLLEIIEQRKSFRRLDCPYVFHLKGRPIKEFRKTWRAACVAAGVGRLEKLADGKTKKYTGIIVHDLRRCAARNLSRGGRTGSRGYGDHWPQNPEHVPALPHCG